MNLLRALGRSWVPPPSPQKHSQMYHGLTDNYKRMDKFGEIQSLVLFQLVNMTIATGTFTLEDFLLTILSTNTVSKREELHN